MTGAFAVLDREHIHYAVRTGATWRYGSTPTPAGLCTDLPRIVGQLRPWLDASDVTIILPVDPTAGGGREACEAALASAGWSTPHTEGGWFSARQPLDGRIMQLGVRVWMPDDPMIGVVRPAPEVVRALVEWQTVTGVSYRHTPGVSAIVALRSLSRAKTPRWQLKTANPSTLQPEWWEPPARIVDIRWGRLAPGRKYDHWDIRGAYLAAAGQVALPYGRLDPTGGAPDHDAVGYFRVRIDNSAYSHIVRLLGRRDSHGCQWTTHDVVRHLRNKYIQHEIIDSYTSTDSGRILRPWADHWRNAINAATPLTRPVLKLGYAQAIGLMDVPKGSIYRPDWRHMIIGSVQASILRRIQRVEYITNMWPTRIDVDSIWYHTGNDATKIISAALGVGAHNGNMRYEGVDVG